MVSLIPATTLEPFVYVEFDSSNAQASPSIQQYRALVIGQRIASGSIDELIPTRVTSETEAATFFGFGSHLHLMARAWFANNASTETWFVAQDDDGSAVDAVFDITVVGTATAAGAIFLYVAGQLIKSSVAVGDDATTIAATISTDINATLDTPVTSSASLGVVTCTAKNGGEQGNAIDFRVNLNPGETLPAGVSSVTAANTTPGATDPGIAAVLAVLGDVQYNVFAYGNDTQTNLAALDVELLDRWGPIRAIEGVAVVGSRGTFGELSTLGGLNNSQFISDLGADNSPTPPWMWAAAGAANVARFGAADPARPFKSLVLERVVPPVSTDLFTLLEREGLVGDGVATWTVDASGRAAISRMVTFYKTTPQGTPDTAFQDINTALILGFFRFDFRSVIGRKFPRHKLADDGSAFGSGQPIVTPDTLKAETIAIAGGWVELGLMENLDDFSANINVERDPTNVSRLNVFMAPDLVNKYLVTGATVGFKL